MPKKNPVSDYLETKEAEEKTATQKRNEKELELWQRWKESGKKPEHLTPLLNAFQPLLDYRKKNNKAPRTPDAAFTAEGHKLIINALNTYNPDRGAALRTHVENGFKKLHRYNASMQNFAYMPETRAGKVGDLDRAHEFLKEELGRDPTPQELAEHMNNRFMEAGKKKRVTPKEVEQITRERIRDFRDTNSRNPEDTRAESLQRHNMFEEQQIALAKDALPKLFPGKPMLHSLFNYTYGTNGHPQVRSTNQLAKHLGVKPSRVSRLKAQMHDTLADEFGLPRIKKAELEILEDDNETDDDPDDDAFSDYDVEG